MISLDTVGDLLGLMFFLYKSQVIQVSHDTSEIRLALVLKDHLVFMTRKKNVSVTDGAVHLSDIQAEQDFLKWAHLYDNYIKLEEKYSSDPNLEDMLLENENDLKTIEMELIMNMKPL